MASFRVGKRKGERFPPAWLTRMVTPVLDRLEATLGVKLLRKDGKVDLPMKCGSYGCVFLLEGDDRRILKITEDALEGPYSHYIRMLQQANVHTKEGPVRAVTVRVDRVAKVAEDEDRVVFAILEERVDPAKSKLPEALIDGSDQYTDGWDLVVRAQQMRSLTKAGEAYTKAERDIAEGLDEMGRGGPRGKAIAEFLRLVYEDGHPLTDVHRSNLCIRSFDGPPGSGERKGQIVVIDFGVSAAKSPFRKGIPEIP